MTQNFDYLLSMIKSRVGLLLFIAIFQLAVCDPIKVSESFTGNDFNNADGILQFNKGWITNGAPAHITECSGTKMFGGFGKFGAKAVASKIFELPPHSSINLKLQFWKYRMSFIIELTLGIMKMHSFSQMINQSGQENLDIMREKAKNVDREEIGRKQF